MRLFILLQDIDIVEKVKNAPDSSYEIGVLIGTFLPFLILIGIAYLLYYKAKKRNNSNNQ